MEACEDPVELFSDSVFGTAGRPPARASVDECGGKVEEGARVFDEDGMDNQVGRVRLDRLPGIRRTNDVREVSALHGGIIRSSLD